MRTFSRLDDDMKTGEVMDSSKNIVDVKLALAAKYERLAKVSNSRPKRASLATQALKYRRQAAQLKQQPQK
ncbi:hypothetical protein [Planctomicrobium sp. SH527]|uniref:hypothetical protein n=1 Tax=Planctomicrobium sp. SH527 TaxID=3448123 RepID=UPI003F5C0BC7